MTNYNERLDEVLADHREWMRGIRTDRLVGTSSEATKQAITSLIKELVAEAKPERRDEPSPASGYYAGGNGPVKNSYQVFSEGYNAAIDQFEQNLLKALEDK